MRWGPAAPLLPLLPLLGLLPALAVLPRLWHGGGIALLGEFCLAALTPSLEAPVLWGVLEGLTRTIAIAWLGWGLSLGLGLILAVFSSATVWQTCCRSVWPAVALRRLLAVPRAVHELVWGLMLLQVLGMKPAVAIAAITIPYAALVARVVCGQLDTLPTANLDALLCSGSYPVPALLTTLAPGLLPTILSYGGYRLECALRSATLLGVFGMGGLGTSLRLTMRSLQFHELWSGLWALLVVMLLLGHALTLLRARWSTPRSASVGQRGRELTLALMACLALMLASALLLNLQSGSLSPVVLAWGWHPARWADALLGALGSLPWLSLCSRTVLMTALATCLAVGLPPLLWLVVGPQTTGRMALALSASLARLLPPPLIALMALFVMQPGLVAGGFALGLHNSGVLMRLLMEQDQALGQDQVKGSRAATALGAAGCPPRQALLYGRFSALAAPYLAYGAYRADVILRETAAVGLVGATGLGSQLMESLSSFAWGEVSAVVAAYVLLTLVGEAVSDCAKRGLLRPTP